MRPLPRFLVAYKASYLLLLCASLWFGFTVGYRSEPAMTQFRVWTALVLCVNVAAFVLLSHGQVAWEVALSVGRLLTIAAGASLLFTFLLVFSPLAFVFWLPIMSFAGAVGTWVFWAVCALLFGLELTYCSKVIDLRGARSERVTP